MIKIQKPVSELKITINRGNNHKGKATGRGHLWVQVEAGGEKWLLTPSEAMKVADGLVDAAELLLAREEGGNQPSLKLSVQGGEQ